MSRPSCFQILYCELAEIVSCKFGIVCVSGVQVSDDLNPTERPIGSSKIIIGPSKKKDVETSVLYG